MKLTIIAMFKMLKYILFITILLCSIYFNTFSLPLFDYQPGSLTPIHREGALNKITSNSELGLEMSLDRAMSAMCPDESTEEGLFHAEVLHAAQRWFASQGWPGGPYPILIPETLRV